MNLEETINKYNELYNSPRIQEINKLTERNNRKIQNQIEEIERNVSLSLKVLLKSNAHKTIILNPPITIDYGDVLEKITYDIMTINNNNYSILTLSNRTTHNSSHLIPNDIYLDKYKQIKEQLIKMDENIKLILETYEPFYNKYKKINSLYKTRTNIGNITKEMLEFFNCPQRTDVGDTMNLIIETTKYSTGIRIPALHYWNIQRYESKRSLQKYNNTMLLINIYYDTIKTALKYHFEKCNNTEKILIKDINTVNNKLLKYFVLAKINGGDDE